MSLGEPPGIEEFRARRRATFYPKTDLPFSRAEIQEILARKCQRTEELLPEVQRAAENIFGETPLRVQALPELGTFHSLYEIEFEKEHWFFRADALDLFGPACDLLIEEQVARVLYSRGIPVPLVLRADLTRLNLDFDFEILERAPGRCLREIENPDTQALPEAILGDLGRTLAKIHQVHVRGFGLLDAYPPFFGTQKSWPDYIHLRLDDHLARCQEIGAINSLERVQVEALFARSESLLKSAPCQLLHGDPGHHNIFVQGDLISCVIDWEDALGGDPVFDLAYWGTFCRDEMRAPLLTGYQEVATLPDDFEQRYWLYYLRVALSKTVHRWLFSRTDPPGRPPASQRIQKALARCSR